MNTLKSFLGGIVLATSLATSALAAGVEVNASNTGLALQGYDPVAYFTEGEATPGSYKITSVYNETTYRFSSEAHKATFEANPEAYLPQYGGYCAFAVAHGATAKTDADAWTIHDGKLYLNFNKSVRAKWRKDIPGFVERADANWPTVLEA